MMSEAEKTDHSKMSDIDLGHEVLRRYDTGPERYTAFLKEFQEKLNRLIPEVNERPEKDPIQLLDSVVKTDLPLAAKIADLYVNTAETHRLYTMIVNNIIDRYPQLDSQEQHMVTFTDQYVSGLYDKAMEGQDYQIAHIICGSKFVKSQDQVQWKQRSQLALEGMARQAMAVQSLPPEELLKRGEIPRMLIKTVFDFYRVGDDQRYEFNNVPPIAIEVAKKQCELWLRDPMTAWKALSDANDARLDIHDPEFYKTVQSKNTFADQLKADVTRLVSRLTRRLR